MNGYFYPTPSGLAPYDGYASGNRQYLADTVALPGQGGTLDADKHYPGMSVWDSSLGKPKWWTGSGWWQPVAAPITPADTSFVQAAEGEYQQQPNFTSALNTADPDFKPNTRLNGSGGESTDVRTYTMWTSSYIGCKAGDVIRVRCPDGTFESGGGSIVSWATVMPPGPSSPRTRRSPISRCGWAPPCSSGTRSSRTWPTYLCRPPTAPCTPSPWTTAAICRPRHSRSNHAAQGGRKGDFT